ncbi:hypothetical protein [Microseira wollei]|uniref:hypothetical protein n=1 Tax=Microseira wollei TaxID=467598 RepID=UPI001CFE6537|nr:hypothetical protein [Microseira wollei]
MAIIAPVGRNDDWEQVIENLPIFPFRQIMASAHPCFAPLKGEMFTVNIVKSIDTFFQFYRVIKFNLNNWVNSGYKISLFSIF